MVVSGTDVVNHKPHPEGIHKILHTLALQPREALMVGDTLSDIAASRAAGVRMASVVWDSYDKERVMQANAECVFHEVNEVIDWLRAQMN